VSSTTLCVGCVVRCGVSLTVCDGPESLLSSGVPHLHFDGLPPQLDRLQTEVDADGCVSRRTMAGLDIAAHDEGGGERQEGERRREDGQVVGERRRARRTPHSSAGRRGRWETVDSRRRERRRRRTDRGAAVQSARYAMTGHRSETRARAGNVPMREHERRSLLCRCNAVKHGSARRRT
jgi:hypothetical protein